MTPGELMEWQALVRLENQEMTEKGRPADQPPSEKAEKMRQATKNRLEAYLNRRAALAPPMERRMG